MAVKITTTVSTILWFGPCPILPASRGTLLPLFHFHSPEICPSLSVALIARHISVSKVLSLLFPLGGGRLFCNHSSPSHTHPLVLAWTPGTSAVKSFSLSNQVSPIPSSWWQRCPLHFSDGWAHALPFLSSRPGSTSAERLDNWLLPCARISVLHFPPLVGSSLPADQWAIYLPNPTLQSTS